MRKARVARGLRNEKGMAILPVVIVLAILSLSLQYVLYRSDDLDDGVASLIWRKQAFHVADGMRNLAVPILQSQMSENPDVTDTELATNLQNKLETQMPTGYHLSSVSTEIVSRSPEAVIPNGPFAGMNASMSEIELKVDISKGATTQPVSIGAVDARLMVGFVSMFQFLFFMNVERSNSVLGPLTQWPDRIHSNGQWCLGGGNGTYFGKVTAADRVLSHADPDCGSGTADFKSFIARDASFTTFAQLKSTNDHGCVNCDGSGQDWAEYALTKWGGNVLDKAHGVAPLLPVSVQGASIQRGYSGSTLGPASYPTSFRFLVDPVLPTDTGMVRSQKFAYQADIRILNGIWYLRDINNPSAWPGIPIWSDHPGNTTVTLDGIDTPQVVGQDDLRVARGWTSTPRYFSYYEYDSAAGQLIDNNEGVISYGSLFNTTTGSPSRWTPGAFVASTGAGDGLCPTGQTLSCGSGTAACGLINTLTAALTCSGAGPHPLRPTHLLNATRAGFVDPHTRESYPGTTAEAIQMSRMYPINFDVHAFQVALQQTGSGELGSYFGSTGLMGAPFNGIIYISSLWPDSQLNYGSSTPPPPYPVQGGQSDTRQMAATSPAMQRALPQYLCTNSVAGNTDVAFDRADAERKFMVPRCSDYAPLNASGIAAYPNSVRVINGSNLDGAVLTKGLSVVSNIFVSLMGDYNSNSNTSSMTATPWVSSLVAGDIVNLFSGLWTDDLASWAVPGSLTSYRPAQDTTWVTSILNGRSTPAFSEWWAAGGGVNHNANFKGSWVHGFNQVYMKSEVKYFSASPARTYVPGNRNYIYDPHLRVIANQPPGSPALPVNAIYNWRRY